MDGEKLSVDSLQSNTTGLPEDYEKRTAAADLESSTPDPVEEVGEPPALTAPALFDGATLEPTATNKSAVPSVNNVKSIPNGGLKAWLQVLGAFFLFFNSWGIINTFGVYQTYYESGILSSSTPSDISWIGSVQAFLLMFVGFATGPIYDAGYFRGLVLAGSFLVPFGHFMLSLATEYYQVFLAQAICVGIGAGCLFTPSVALLSTYFTTKLATAMGLAAAGSSLGGVIYPIVLYRLLPIIGFGWATRVIGFMALATLITSNIVMRVRVIPASKRKMFDLAAFTELPYFLFIAASFLAFAGLYGPFFYSGSYSLTKHITSDTTAYYLVPIINSASILGRILPNLVADRVGPMNVISTGCVVSGILAFLFIAVGSEAAMIVLCLLYGFSSGALVSLPPTVLVHLSMKKRAMIGTRMGQAFCITSIGLLLGTPICGWILGASSFTYVFVFCGVLVVCGGLLMVAARIAHAGPKLLIKA